MSRLIHGLIDVNDTRAVEAILASAKATLVDASTWHPLSIRSKHYFATSQGALPAEPGWYLICDESGAVLYVGEAENLDVRLNSPNGSLDNFANSKRSSDSVRNFIKSLTSAGILKALRVGIIPERSITGTLGIKTPLSKLDRCNVEKLLDIFRERVVGNQ